MSFDPSKYIVGINLGEYFVDKDTGLPLSGGKIYFKKDTNRSVGKYVYTLTGTPGSYSYEQLENPITLSSVGTIVDEFGNNIAVYYYPYDENGSLDLYYVQVTDSEGIAGGNIQLERQAWPNVSIDVNPTDAESGKADNQVTNPQFSDIFFLQEEGILLEWTGAITSQVFPIGPGWNLIVSASDTGSIQIDRLQLEGSLNINTNPPYALTILPEGASISSIKLRQVLNDNPSIWANNTLSGFMLISSLDSLAHTIEMTYGTSTPNIPQTVISSSTGTTGYVSAVGTVDIGGSANTEAAPEGFTYIDILLPRTGFVAISSVQIMPVEPNTGAAAYIQNSINKQQSDLFYYYNPLLQAIPVPSITEGWDFKVNPAQFSFNSVANSWAGASKYIWDQTIGWQSADNLISASRDGAGRLAIATATTGQFALVQYLSAPQMQSLLVNGWSTLINAYTDNTSGASGTVSFYYTTDASLPNINSGSSLSLISTVDSNGKPATFHGNWIELPNPLLGENRFTIPYNTDNTTSSIALNGWSQPLYGITSTATFVAVVIGFESLPTANVYFDSISVTPGRLAVPFSPLDYSSTLFQMQYYYQKSVWRNEIPSIGTITNAFMSTTYATTSIIGNTEIKTDFQDIYLPFQEKRSASNIVNIYSVTSGSSNSFNNVILSHGSIILDTVYLVSDYFEAYNLSYNGLSLISLQNGATVINSTTSGLHSLVFFQWSSDARYGIV